MSRRNKILKDPESFSVDELVRAIQSGEVTLNELKATGLLDLQKRYAINERLAGGYTHRTVRENPGPVNPPASHNDTHDYDDGWGPAGSYRGGGANRGRRTQSSPSNWWKYAIIVLCVGLVIGGGWFAYGRLSKPSPEQIYEKYKNSVVFVVHQFHYEATVNGEPLGESLGLKNPSSWTNWSSNEDSNEEYDIVSGTGFFISNDGKIMTNRHVVDISQDEETRLKVKKRVENELKNRLSKNVYSYETLTMYNFIINDILPNLEITPVTDHIYIGKNNTYISELSDLQPCTLVQSSHDSELDVAIIQLNNMRTPDEARDKYVDVNGYKLDALKLGAQIYSIGFPLSFVVGQTKEGFRATNVSGTINQECGTYTYGNSLTVQHGASGSPIFDDHGRFAGVVVSGLFINGANQGYNRAIMPNKAASLL